ncbi:MAG TPA: DUF5054 domain-containing protein [Anaerolineaceae bacterium]|nr:DUF5054 domain-containing protein [Anaerolineaceae bacterium]HUM62697.1 DUF5054 domain-containing protein [Anaerolineaceae bacterium]
MERSVHLIFKTHLDVGFTDYAAVVVRNYFKKYIPAALRLARELRQSGSDRFIWTTGSWLIYEYLEQASSAERGQMEEAILAGDIAWHALPFTTHTELMDAELFRFGLSLSRTLDQRFGRHTIAAKWTDVPGHTRAIIPLLAEAGVVFLHIGVNPGSTVPSVPSLFRWQDPGGAELLVMYESGYGSVFEIPGLEHSLAFGHTMDNMGPQSHEQVLDVYREVRSRQPGARVFASTLSDFAAQLVRVRENLPVLSQEIGDTWIHGVGSDPIKVARFRELLRLRAEWLASGRVTRSEPSLINLNRWLLMVPEHTWGMDEKTWLNDHENYTVKDFNLARGQPNFQRFEASWVEKRAYPQLAVNALGGGSLADEARARLESIRPRVPDLSAWQPIEPAQAKLENPSLAVTFEQQKGSLDQLVDRTTGQSLVVRPGEFSVFSYQTFSSEDYERFFNTYVLPQQRHGWALEDFCKPGLRPEDSPSRCWLPLVKGIFKRSTPGVEHILFYLTFEDEALHQFGAPRNGYLQYSLPSQEQRLHIGLQWFNKQASRMPEALWMTFRPEHHPDAEWSIEKLGREIPALSVVENGNRHLHGSGRYVTCRALGSELRISALDSPLVALGARSLLDFNNDQPDTRQGAHFCLFNNLWGTNFPMWFEEDCRFRFDITLNPTKEERNA